MSAAAASARSASSLKPSIGASMVQLLGCRCALSGAEHAADQVADQIPGTRSDLLSQVLRLKATEPLPSSSYDSDSEDND